jgi:hypothetical protein
MNINTGLILSATGAIGGSSLAYIGPGLTFMAVYHKEFIDLIRTRWQTSSKYLWQYPSVDSDSCEQTLSVGIITWYVLLMPVWSSIAQLGECKMSEYIEKEDSLSPGLLKPKRVTVVTPTRLSRTNLTNENYNLIQLPRCPSDSAMDGKPNDEDAFLIHPNLQTRQAMYPYGSTAPCLATRLSAVEIEEEMKPNDPTWTEFYIAMFYVVIGVVAMALGLVSILTK